MTLSVLALWGCIALEQAARHHAATDVRAVFRTLEHLKQPSIPAAEPMPRFGFEPARSS